MKTSKSKVLAFTIGCCCFFSSLAKAAENSDIHGIKSIQRKVEKHLKLPERLKSEIKAQSVEVFFKVNEQGNVISVVTHGENKLLNEHVKAQFMCLSFPELNPDQHYRIVLKYQNL